MEVSQKIKDIWKDVDLTASLQNDLDKLDSRFFAEIGKISTAWTIFERILDANIHLLIGHGIDKETAACVTAQIPNTPRRFDALLALVRLRGGAEDLVKRINKYGEKSIALGLKRNRTIHDTWGVHADGRPVRHEVSAQKKLIHEERYVELKELEALRDEVINHVRGYEVLFREILQEVILTPLASLQKQQ